MAGKTMTTSLTIKAEEPILKAAQYSCSCLCIQIVGTHQFLSVDAIKFQLWNCNHNRSAQEAVLCTRVNSIFFFWNSIFLLIYIKLKRNGTEPIVRCYWFSQTKNRTNVIAPECESHIISGHLLKLQWNMINNLKKFNVRKFKFSKQHSTTIDRQWREKIRRK